tara:strand:+ start:288 stop:521 length:234 start_codon:yes stop_codon:yes gene_type:complete
MKEKKSQKVATYKLDNGKIIDVYECYTLIHKDNITKKRVDYYDLFHNGNCINLGETWYDDGQGLPTRVEVNSVFGII